MVKNILSAVIFSVISFLYGCASVPIPGFSHDPYEGLSQLEKDNLQLREWNKVRVRNENLENYLYGVLAELFGEQQLKDYGIRVALIADPNPGASVSADGLVIWYLGNFQYLDSEDEVAAMLAHEMTHLVAGHHETTESESFSDKLMAAGETAAVFSGAGSAAELWVAASSVRWASDSVLFPSFTREEETEADIEAARLLVAAGYNADAVRVILGKLRDFYGDRSEFEAQKVVHFVGQNADGSSHYRIDLGAALNNLTGYVQNQWGQEYESFTERESAVRTTLMTEFPERKRGEFSVSAYKDVIGSGKTKEWLAAHQRGFEVLTLDLTDAQSFEKFKSLAQKMIGDPLTSVIFDYDILFNAALRNGLDGSAQTLGVELINSNVATLSHYLMVGNYRRQHRDYKQAIAVFSLADAAFSSEQDKILLPLILATKDDAGIPQGNTAIRCLDPTVMMACLKRK